MIEGQVIGTHLAMSVATSNYAKSPQLLGRTLGDVFFPQYWRILWMLPSLTFGRMDRPWLMNYGS